MTVYLALLLAGLVLGLLFTPLVTSASTAVGLVDAPGGRKVHSTAVPRVGGVAIVLAASAAFLIVTRLLDGVSTVATDFRPVAPIMFGAGLVFAIGLLDDFAALPPWPKAVVQILATMLVMSSGLLIERITVSNYTLQLGLLSYPVTLMWVVGLTNAFNLIDGIDGLAAGIAVIAGTTCAAILVNRGHAAEAMLVIALVGAAIGFLVYNFNPATIFLGDCGSLVFGFVLATTAITGWQKGATALAAGVPLLVFALPLADAGSTLLRRMFRRPASGRVTPLGLLRQIAEPDREHIHHRLLALGWSTRQIVIGLYLVTLILAAAALATAQY